MAYVIGLTGAAGSGKSSAADAFRTRGIPVVDADAIAYRVCEPGSAGLKEIARAFGKEYIRADGSYDRDRMRELVSSDPEALKKLNKILHPLIKRERERAFSEIGDQLFVYDCPLLFEAGEDAVVDEVLVVTVSPDVRVERVMERDGLSREEALKLIDLQDDEREKLRQADSVIYNDGSLEELDAAVGAYLRTREKTKKP